MTDEQREKKSYQTYFEEKYWQKLKFVSPGEFYCSSEANEILAAETGAGVIICMYDIEAHVGGIAHILIPDSLIKNFKDHKDHSDEIIAYAKSPLEELIKEMKYKGAGKKRINIRLSGGATIMNDEFDMGLKNVVFAQNEIIEKGLKLITQDIGGEHCRRINFFPYTGRMEKLPLRRDADQAELWAREQEYLKQVREKFGLDDNKPDNK